VNRVLLLLFLCCALGSTARVSAQGAGEQWISFADDSEFFRVSFPHTPETETINGLPTNFGALDVRGKSYLASANGAVYAVWALSNSGDRIQHRKDPDSYLDATAELIWEGLLKPARDKLPEDRRMSQGISYTKELTNKSLPGREYTATVGDMTGTIQFYVAESRVYVLMAMGPPGGAWTREPLFATFTLSPSLSALQPPDGTEAGQGSEPANDADLGQILKSSEVSQRARVLEKPEPTYTESARKFQVTGTVVLRAIFSKNGEVTNIHVLRKLPHGLTQRAVDSARRIKFTPALKDGQPVSVWFQLEYNFNLY
jgi:TonB family protein